MAYVVTEPCIKCKFTDCVSQCPVGCFREGANMLVIDPEECINCNLCVDECPVGAIFPEEEIPEKWEDYIELNERLATQWPEILVPKEPPTSADEFREIDEKRHLLEESAWDESKV